MSEETSYEARFRKPKEPTVYAPPARNALERVVKVVLSNTSKA